MVPFQQPERLSRERPVGEEHAIRDALGAASVGLWQLNASASSFACDAECARILGLPAEIGHVPMEALAASIPAEDRTDFLLRVKAAIVTGHYDHTHRIALPDGSVRWVRSVGSRVRPSTREGLLAGILMDVTSIKEAEAAVTRREEALRLLEQATDIGIYETQPDGSCVGSPSFFRQLGISPAASWHFEDFLHRVHPADRAKLRKETELALAGADLIRTDFRIIRADTGEERWLSTLAQIFRDASGAPCRSIGAHIDITRQKRVEEELRASREELATVFSQTIVGILHRNLSLHVLTVNERFCQIIGRSPEELENLPVDAFTHPDDAAASAALFQEHAPAGTPFSTDKRYLRPDGSAIWCEVHVSFVRDAQGRVRSTITVATDISERKRVEREREHAAQWLRLALEGAAAGTLELDFEADRIKLNAVSRAMYGSDAAVAPDIDLERWQQLLHPDDAAKIRAVDFREPRSMELRVRSAVGETRWIKIIGRLDRDDAGNRRVTGLQFDVTESKRAEEALRDSEERLRLVQDAAAIGSFEVDGEGQIICSDAFRSIYGMKEDFVATYDRLLSAIHPEDRERIDIMFREAHAKRPTLEGMYRIVRFDDGAVRWVLIRAKIYRDISGRVKRLVGALMDFTERKQAELELIETKAISQSIVDASADCIALLDHNDNLLFMNSSGLAGIEAESFDALAGKPWAGFWRRGAQADLHAALTTARKGGTGRFTAKNPTVSGREKWWDVVVTPVASGTGGPIQLLTISRDITDQRNALERIEWAAAHDTLTQLPNRRYFQERLQALVKPGCSSAATLMQLDLDRLKEVNDTLGHAAGDLLIQTFAARLHAGLADGQIAARLGGDEFAILLPDVSEEMEIARFVAALRARLSAPLLYDGREIVLGASIGIAIFPQDGSQPSELLKSADLALYRAKASHRGGTLRFHPEMRTNMRERAEMLRLASAALDGDGIFPFYQPQVRLAGRQLYGLEALLRWRDPAGRIRPPAELINVAFEDPQLAQRVGQRMQDRVIADAYCWIERGLPFDHVAINAAASEFRYDDFAERLLEKLAQAGLDPRRIQIEITEGVFMGAHVDKVARALELLSSNGVTVALDDFGTGFSSLSHLKDFPVDVLKIDRSFVQHLDREKNNAIVGAVLNLGRSLNIAVIAEGVETIGQVHALQKHGCEIGQGYLFGYPAPASKVESALQTELDREMARSHATAATPRPAVGRAIE
jgi:diguanylate cyclase (GGDEF)-like protein/PAS domain S-box-containing protein